MAKIDQAPNEQELQGRIRELEEQNSVLRDKLDMIYSIIASDHEEQAEVEGDDDDSGDIGNGGLVQIKN